MRQATKNRIIELLKTLLESNTMLLRVNVEERQMLLEGAQNAAISVGNQIEESEGEGCDAVKPLEEYCEVIWNASNDPGNIEGYINEMNSCITTAIESVDTIERTYEVVFMPYKASMWDCMETIWEAAVENPKVTPYVIPIPYCDRDNNGKAAQWYCERSLMPKNVPTTDWQEYDLSEHRPDVIFIHNPYDGSNYVTSVDSRYYSEELKKYAEKLVYVPYYSLQNHLPEGHSYLAAYPNVDYIVLGNEQMKDDIDSRVPREKLLSFGWPKDERIKKLNANRDKLDVPKEWKNILDGKKVVFYNTSISNLLQNGDKRLDKIEEFINTISMTEGIAVIWRPHPLLEATFKSMRPTMLKRYHDLLNKFKRTGKGVIDETPDPGIAVAISDAYIGDSSSSIVHLFEVLDKPRFFQSDELIYQPTWDELESDVFSFMAMAEDGESFYSIAQNSQIIYKVSEENLDYQMVAKIPGDRGAWKYNVMLNVGDKIYIAANLASSGMLIFDTVNKTFSKVYFEEEMVSEKFAFITEKNGIVYLFPREYSSIIKYNPDSNIVDYISMTNNADNKDRICSEHRRFSVNGITIDNTVYIPCYDDNCILVFDILSEQIKYIYINESENGFLSVVHHENILWITSYREPKVFKYNLEQKCVVEIYTFEDEKYNYPGAPLNLIGIKNDKAIVVPHAGSYTYFLDILSGNIRKEEKLILHVENDYRSEYYRSRSGIGHGMIKMFGDKLFAVNMYDMSLEKYDIEDGLIGKKRIRCELCQDVEAQKYKNGITVIGEQAGFSTSRLLYWLDKGYACNRLYNYYNTDIIEDTGKKILEDII